MKNINDYINESMQINESYKDFVKTEENSGNNTIIEFKTSCCPKGYFNEHDKVAFSKSDWEYLKTNTELDKDNFLNLICNVDYGTAARSARNKLSAFYKKFKDSKAEIIAMEDYPSTLVSYSGGSYNNVVASRIFIGVKFNDKKYNKLEEEFKNNSENVKEFKEYSSTGKTYEVSNNMLKITINGSFNSSSMIVKFK